MNRNDIALRLWGFEARARVSNKDYVLLGEAAEVWVRDRVSASHIRIGVKSVEILDRILKLSHDVMPEGGGWVLTPGIMTVQVVPNDMHTKTISGYQLESKMCEPWMRVRNNTRHHILTTTKRYLRTEVSA